jgi:subtilisin-like proprotein convertase family protein
MLQANPQLGWRDVPAILAATAQKNDPADAGWATNGAGYHVNHKYGFGRVDVAAAVAAAAARAPLGPETSAEASASPALAIPDGSAADASSTVTLADDITVEWVDVWLTADHTKWTQLEVVLTSPAGTESVLATAERTSAPSAGYANWRFGSARHLGESSQGAWTLTVRDLYSGTSGTFSSWRVKVYGTPAADATPPVTTHDYDGLWHNSPVTVTLAAADEPGGSGMTGGQARTEYSRDGGLTWQQGTEVAYHVWKRGGGSGVHTLLYRSADAAGNTEAARSVDVLMDARAPLTTDDAPAEPRADPVTVHLTAVDSLFGVTACSGVAATWHSLDGGPWTLGTTIAVSGPGVHSIAYYSVDVAGNAAYPRVCFVEILGGK